MAIVFIALWAVIGLAIGWIVSKVINLRGDDPLGGILVAAIASTLGGAIANLSLGAGLTTWHPWALVWSAVSALVAVGVWHAIRARYVSHATQSFRRSY